MRGFSEGGEVKERFFMSIEKMCFFKIFILIFFFPIFFFNFFQNMLLQILWHNVLETINFSLALGFDYFTHKNTKQVTAHQIHIIFLIFFLIIIFVVYFYRDTTTPTASSTNNTYLPTVAVLYLEHR